jgi:hypothetical protein
VGGTIAHLSSNAASRPWLGVFSLSHATRAIFRVGAKEGRSHDVGVGFDKPLEIYYSNIMRSSPPSLYYSVCPSALCEHQCGSLSKGLLRRGSQNEHENEDENEKKAKDRREIWEMRGDDDHSRELRTCLT